MRQSRHYADLMEKYAARKMPMKPGGIGWLGDQTLYSWMTVNGTGARQIFYEIPCGWNRQIGTHMAGWPGFWSRHACQGPCHLLHGNYVAHKSFMEQLKRDPTGRSCARVVRHHRTNDPLFRNGTADARMLDMIGEKCCRSIR
eukprot:6204403-Pleurochrysis_carterae.AAC.2